MEGIVMEEKKRKLRTKDIVYLVDFVINVALVIMILLSAHTAYLTGKAGSMLEALVESDMIVSVCLVFSILVVLFEILYAIGRIRGKEPEDMNIVDKWPNVWIYGKILILIAVIATRALG